MKNKLYIKFTAIVLIFAILLAVFPMPKKVSAVGPDVDYTGETSMTNASPEPTVQSDEYIVTDEDIVSTTNYTEPASIDTLPLSNYPSRIGSYRFDTNKIEFNASDRRDLEIIQLVGSVVPDLYSDLEELSHLSGHSIEDLFLMRFEDYITFDEVVEEVEGKYFTNSYIKERLLANHQVLAEILNESVDYLVNSLQNNPETLDSELDRILDIRIDRRILKTLIYLTTPKHLGGAGHWKIKVYRLRRNYSRENTKHSRESLEAEEKKAEEEAKADQTIELFKSETDSSEINELLDNSGLNESEVLVAGEIQSSQSKIDQQISDFIIVDKEHSETISSHFKGQAIDITEVDDFKCTLIQKKRVGSDKKTPEPPKPLKLQWQTSEGYGVDQDAIDSSYNDMFMRMSEDAVVEMLSSMDIDFSELGNMEYADFGDIVSIIGQAFLSNSINAPNGEIWKFDLPGVLRSLGGVIVADNLNLDREPFLDTSINTIDGLSEAIGRYAIERRLNLPYGALNGATRDEIFIQTGMSRIAYELGLPYDIFNYEMQNEDQVHQAVGSRIVEEELGLTFGSFYNKSSLKEVEDSTGKFKLKGLLAFPSSIDNILNLPDRTSEQLKSGAISPIKFNEIVARSHLVSIVYNYPNMTESSGNENLKDEMFNFPEGTIDRFLTGTLNSEDLKNAGYSAVAEALETSDTLRASLEDFLRNPNIHFSAKKYKIDNGAVVEVAGEIEYLSRNKYASTLGIDESDLEKIFVSSDSNNARGVYHRLGERILVEAVKNSSAVQRKVNDLKDRIPAVADVLDTYEFYSTRIDEIKSHSASIRSRSAELQAKIDTINDPTLRALSQQMNVSISELNSTLDLLDNSDISASNIYSVIETIIVEVSSNSNRISYELGALSNMTEVRGNNEIIYLINALNSDVEIVAKASYEIVTGQSQNGFRLEDLNISNMMNGTTGELVLLLSGKIEIKDFLVYHASVKLGNELNLPPLAFKYAAAVIESVVKDDVNIKDAFYRAFGMAQLEEQAGIGGFGRTLDNKDLSFSVSIIQIRDGLVQNANMSRQNANQVILNALNLKGFSFEALTRGEFGAWALARERAKENDIRNKMPIGTTEAFVKSAPLGQFDQSAASNNEVRELVTKSAISEAALQTFVAVRDGAENPSINKIYYVDNNRFRSYEDSSGQCAAKTSPDDAYYYFDTEGQHVFNSYAAANEFRLANPDKEVDYQEEIKSAIVNAVDDWTSQSGSLLPDDSNPKIDIDNKISSFLNNKSQSKFANYDSLVLVFETKGISNSATEKIFTRGTRSDGDVPIDFLKIYGYSIIEHYAINYINDYLGISFGRTRLTPGDFFDLFNGNAKEVFGRVGGAIMDEELGLYRGTVEEILTATNSDQRKCAMERAAMQMLGDILGIRGLGLSGSIYDNFGGGRIESFLGLPKKSFQGADLDDLISKIGKVNFVRAFRVPIPKETDEFVDYFMQTELGLEFYNAHRSKNVILKIEAVELYLQALDSDPNVETRSRLRGAWQKINSYLDKAISTLKGSSSDPIWNGIEGNNAAIENYNQSLNNQNDDTPPYSEQEFNATWRQFIARLNTLDNAFGLNSKQTENLMRGKISPDNYRKTVSDQLIESIAIDVLINALGLDGTGINSSRVNELKNALKFLKNGDLFGSFNNTTPAAIIYEFLDDLFSFNLDKKAGFSYGTIERILTYPDRAMPVILREGAILLDRQLGLGSNANSYGNDIGPGLLRYLSLANIVDFAYGTEADYQICQSITYPNDTFSSHKDCMDKRRKVKYRSVVKQTATEAINKFLLNETSVRVETTGPGGQIILSDKKFGIDMPLSEIKQIFDGDLRPFYVFSMAYGIGSILGDENGTLRVSEELVFEFMDIYYAFYGNPLIEEAARVRAENRVYALENADPAQIDAYLPILEPGPPLPRGSQLPTSYSSYYSATTAPSVPELVIGNINSQYALPADANITPPSAVALPELPSPNNPAYYDSSGTFLRDKFLTDRAAALTERRQTFETNQDNYEVIERARLAGEEAARDARKMFVEQFKYRVSDCLLAKFDSRIPAGFSWAMWKGNEYIRTAYVLQYVENWMHDEGFFDFLPEEFRELNLLNPFYAFLNSPDSQIKGNWTTLMVSSRALEAIDDFLINRAPTVMGMNFQGGTAGALYAWIKTGSTTQNYTDTIGGQSIELKSLSEIYGTDWVIGRISNWADRKLGLPSGTMYQFYSFYDQYQAIQTLSTLMNKLDPGTIGAMGGENFGLIEGYGNYLAENAGLPAEELKTFKEWAKPKLKNIKTDLYAAMISFVIDLAFSKQIASLEQAIGLVPGSGALLVTMAVNILLGVSVTVPLVMFIALNLFGVYKTIFSCTPDGYYPAMESPPDSNKWDSASGVGTFNALNPRIREQKYIESAQYKANRLVGDLYEMPYRTGDENLVPTQVMTGRREDVISWAPYLNDTVCTKVGGGDASDDGICNGTKAGLWQNPQMTSYTHIGF